MKSPLFLVPMLLLAGCARRETTPETIVVVAPSPTPVVLVKVVPAPKPAATSNTTVIVVPPPKKTIVVVPPQPKIEKIVPTAIPKPTPKPKPKPTAKPVVKVAPTAKPKPAIKPLIKPTAKPISKPNPPQVAKPTPSLIVRGEVIQTSVVPDPSTVAYSDSLVFSKYKVLSVEKGVYQPQEILVAQWGMKAKKLTPAARLRAGDVARLELVPLDARPELERIMRNDDTADYDSAPYFALEP